MSVDDHEVRDRPSSRLETTSLDLTLEEYFAAAGAIGLLSAQLEEPDPEWASKWALDFGRVMAAEARKRRRKR